MAVLNDFFGEQDNLDVNYAFQDSGDVIKAIFFDLEDELQFEEQRRDSIEK